MPPKRGQREWPNVAADDRDEAYQWINKANELMEQSRREPDETRRQLLIADAQYYNEKAAHILAKNGAKT